MTAREHVEGWRDGPKTACVSPFPKRERALPTIGNTLGLIKNKIIPATQDFSLNSRLRIGTGSGRILDWVFPNSTLVLRVITLQRISERGLAC